MFQKSETFDRKQIKLKLHNKSAYTHIYILREATKGIEEKSHIKDIFV